MKITIEMDKLMDLIEAIQQADRLSLEVTKLNNQLFLKLNQAWQQVYQLIWPGEEGTR